MTNKVFIRECAARDGLQHEQSFVATDKKIALLDMLIMAGFPRIEATSLAHPRYVPQFIDAENVLRALADRRAVDPFGTELMAVCMNERAVVRAIEAKRNGYGPDMIGFAISASDAHSLKNMHKTRKEHMVEVTRMCEKALSEGLNVEGAVAVAWGCPFIGIVPLQNVLDTVKFYYETGIRRITLGDTTGLATPPTVKERLGALRAVYPDVQFSAHFHDTHGTAIANVVAALEIGIRHFDSSLGGLGGNPANINYSLGYTGNVCTEDLVCMLVAMGYETGLDVDKVLAAAQFVEHVLGRELHSRVIRAGPQWRRLDDPEIRNVVDDERS